MKSIFSVLFLFVSILIKAQPNLLQINSAINLPKDSIESKHLITSLNEFLVFSQHANEQNILIYESEKLETYILLDEFNGIQRSDKIEDSLFYKPYLTNVVLLNDTSYLIQISYIGIYESKANLRASFELIAHKSNNGFSFSSPLKRNTKNWKVKTLGNTIFHYQSVINNEKVKEYDKLVKQYDLKLKSADNITEYYLCDNIIELQKLIGVDYKSDYNGRNESVWSASYTNKKLIVFGNNNSSFNEFDPHDLFHDRLSLVISRKKVNKAVDEGCAYLYGGSWGFSWNYIYNAFKIQVATDKKINWLDVKGTPIFFKTGIFQNSADYIVTALLVKKIEKEKGFDGVWELLKVPTNETTLYFQVLENLTGITKENYNQKIWDLIQNEN